MTIEIGVKTVRMVHGCEAGYVKYMINSCRLSREMANMAKGLE